MKSDLVDIEVHKHHATERAIKVSLTGEERKAVWVPLSMCEFEQKRGAIGVLTLSETTAIEKGLV